jgi:hypothetical protein
MGENHNGMKSQQVAIAAQQLCGSKLDLSRLEEKGENK